MTESSLTLLSARPLRHVACTVAALGLTWCFVASPAQAADKISICAIVPTTEIEYFATLLNEYKKAGAERNIDVTTIDSQKNPAREGSAIESDTEIEHTPPSATHIPDDNPPGDTNPPVR